MISNRLPCLRRGVLWLATISAALSFSIGYAGDARFSVTAGALYTSGDYLGEETIEEVYVPLTAAVDAGRVAVRVTVPYLSVRAPAETYLVGPDGQIIVTAGEAATESGLGDVLASLTVLDVLASRSGDLVMDLTGKVKFGTADEARGLGTGEQDYALQADVFRFFDRATAILTMGYWVRGDPADYDLDDTLFASIGGSVTVNDAIWLSAFYDFRESSLPGEASVQEVSLSCGVPVGTHFRAQIFVLKGFSETAPDWGGGVSLLSSF